MVLHDCNRENCLVPGDSDRFQYHVKLIQNNLMLLNKI